MPQERKSLRPARGSPSLDEMKGWLEEKAAKALSKSLLGEAIRLNHAVLAQTDHYLEDEKIPIDNNKIENAICPAADVLFLLQ